MKVMSAQKIRILPNEDQLVVFRKACGTSRYTYNWALTRWQEYKASGVEKVYKNDLKKEWNEIKPTWVYESPKDANQQPINQLYNALGRYFKRTSGFPKKKKKGKSRDSFYVSNDKAHITNRHIKLPLVGRVQMVEPLRYNRKKLKVMSYTVSREAEKWYVSVSFEIDDSLLNKISGYGVVGIDVGLKTFAATSNSENFEAPKPLFKQKKKLKRLQRSLSRKKKRSANRQRAKKKVARLHARIANIRKDFLHKLSHSICSKNKLIVVEDLNIKGMLKNHKLAGHIADAGWGEFSRQLSYKAKRFDSILIKTSMWFPSTKTCSRCGCVKDTISLKDRIYVCAECGHSIDRDLNAAINLLAYALFELIPSASGKFTPMEIVDIAQRETAVLTTVDEVSWKSSSPLGEVEDRDSHWFIQWLRNKVEIEISTMKDVNTYVHLS